MKFTHTTAAIVGLTLLGGTFVALQSAVAQNSRDKVEAEIGEPAPDFTLVDLEDNEHTLSDYTEDGKIVVLEWFSPECPFVVKHYREENQQTMNLIAEEYAEHDVVVLAINSARKGHPYADHETNAEIHEEWGMAHPILFDTDGEVGQAYGARTTPHMYIIDLEGNLRYAGAIDDNKSSNKFGETNYVRQALDEILAGETVTVPRTTAYGCSVKY